MTVFSIADAARQEPKRTALVAGNRSIAFREAAELAARARDALRARGIAGPSNAPVSVVGRSDATTIVWLYALFEERIPVALVHPRLTEGERATQTADTGSIAIVDSDDVHLVTSTTPAPVDVPPVMAVVSSSGTAGRPKGVQLDESAFVASAAASADNLGWQEDDRWLLALPVAHIGGLSVVTRCLLARRTVVIAPETVNGERLTDDGLIQCIERERVTLLSLVPTQLERLLARRPEWNPPPCLRVMLLGGAAARTASLRCAADRGWPVLTTYGLTEACSQVTTQRLGTVNRGQLGSGPPVRGTGVRIVDGVIHVRGPTLLSGYTAGPGALDADGWLDTGDTGAIDEQGNLHVTGRLDDRIISGGENVDPLEVERLLEAFGAIDEACVFGIDDPEWGQIVAAALVAPSGAIDELALSHHLKQTLAPHKRPRQIAFLESLSFNSVGKLDRAATARRAIPLAAALES